MRGHPPIFFFWMSITLVKICSSHIFSKPLKNTFELVGTVLKFTSDIVSPDDFDGAEVILERL